MSLLEKTKKNLQDTAANTLIVAVSGGVDSIVLLDILTKHSNSKLCIAHVNHKLRKDSDKDAAFVAYLATKKNIPFYLYEAKDPPSSNIESWGREIRYKFFLNLKNSLRFDGIATGHTASDAAELFLMQLFSNKTISGMDYLEPRRQIFRPLLSATRNEILEYATKNNLSWVEDQSNQSDRFLRNRVRNKLLPLLNNIFDGDVERTVLLQKSRIENQSQLIHRLSLERVKLTSDIKFGSRQWLGLVREQLSDIQDSELDAYIEALFYPQLKRRLGANWPVRLRTFLLGNSARLQLPGAITLIRSGGGIELTQSERKTTLNQ